MGFFMPAVLGGLGALAGGAFGMAGSSRQADAAQQAAQLQSDAAQRGMDISQQQYAQTREDLEPYRDIGGQAMGRLGSLMQGGAFDRTFGVSPEEQYAQLQRPYESRGLAELGGPIDVDITQDPGYQFRLQQGQEAVEKSAAARGGYFSGQTGIDLQKYGQGLASQEYQSAFDREMSQRQLGLTGRGQEFAERQGEAGQYLGLAGLTEEQTNNLYNRYSGMAGMGQQAAMGTGQFGQQAATAAGGYDMASAGAQAGGITGSAGAYAGGMQNINNQLQGALGTMSQYNLMQQAGLFD